MKKIKPRLAWFMLAGLAGIGVVLIKSGISNDCILLIVIGAIMVAVGFFCAMCCLTAVCPAEDF